MIRIQNISTYVLLIECKKFVRVRDTFAGKTLTTFQKYFPLPRNLEICYRQKCRATYRAFRIPMAKAPYLWECENCEGDDMMFFHESVDEYSGWGMDHLESEIASAC